MGSHAAQINQRLDALALFHGRVCSVCMIDCRRAWLPPA